MALPDTYKQIEYLESTGTQAFKLGTAFKSTYRTVAVVQATNLSSENCPFGMRNTSYQRYYVDLNNGYYYAATGSSTNPSGVGTTDLNKHTFTLNQGTFQVDSTSYSVNNASTNYSNGLPVFAYCNDTDNNYYLYSYCKIYSLKVYNGSTLLYDLTPVVRKSDNKPGMYDLVNNVFYTNQGTGEFVVPTRQGEHKLKQAYIGYVYTPNSNTLLYRPLTENANDYSGNSNNGTAYSSVSFSSNGAYFSGSVYNTNFIDFPSSFYPGTQFTISLWIKVGATNKEIRMFSDWGTNYRRILWCLDSSGYMRLLFGNGNTSQSDWLNIQTYSANTWYNYVLVKNGTSASIYRDGVLVGTHTFSYNSSPGGLAIGEYGIGNIRTSTSSSTSIGTGYVKDYIIESTQWTAKEVQEYYNKTKSLYGIS